MTEDEARRFLIVRAVETEDAGEAMLTREDRRAATAAALSQGGEGRGRDDALLAARADFAFTRLRTRFPAVARADQAAAWPRWLNWAVPLAAFLLGLLTNEIDSGSRLNLIAFPLLGLIAWNLVVYLGLAMRGLSRSRSPAPLARWLSRPTGGADPRLGSALRRFSGDWLTHAGPLITARARRTFHLAAALLAAGIIAGMYLRALGVEYRAGWESTFIGPATLHGLLGAVLAPASAVTGIQVPGPDQLAGLRWSEGQGENAAPWIHLFAVTAALFVIVPRLLLTGWSAARAARLQRRLPVAGRDHFYVRRILRDAYGTGAQVRVIPYSFNPPQAAARRLETLLGAALGDGTQVQMELPVAYGAEDDWLAAARLGAETDHILLLFNLSSTPESENHGAFAAGLRDRLPKGAGLLPLIDESSYRERLAGQSGGEERVATRRQAWERVLRQAGLLPLAIDLSDPDTAGLTRRLEAALIRDAALVPEAAA